jgi:hypothetical protein
MLLITCNQKVASKISSEVESKHVVFAADADETLTFALTAIKDFELAFNNRFKYEDLAFQLIGVQEIQSCDRIALTNLGVSPISELPSLMQLSLLRMPDNLSQAT